MTLSEAKNNIGRMIIYKSFGNTERGQITECNSKFVFVRYGNDCIAKATRPEDIELEQQ